MVEKISEDRTLLKKLSVPQLEELAAEIRRLIIETVAANGGHLSSNLGIVELTIALHVTFDIPPDALIWDVGHQCYTHKILTGRAGSFRSLRREGGISGFPKPQEDPSDLFQTGHAGTAVSAATGLKIGRELTGDNNRAIAVIGDGSLTNGVTFEGLNYLGQTRKNLLVVLNDNKMSISPTKGAMAYYLTKLVSSPVLSKPKEEFAEMLRRIPSIGEDIARMAQDVEKRARYLIIPGVFFEKLGLRYLGPIDGHDFDQLLEILRNIRTMHEPILLHVVTKKGKGYRPAEQNPSAFHGAGKFSVETGEFVRTGTTSPGMYAGTVLDEAAKENTRLVVITAAMEKGLGLESFAAHFPERFFDVGIAESHAVVLAAGMARAGLDAVVAIYSTFLQRAYDQLFQDVCLQNLPVVFLVDRAGLVGEDGPTHHGNFDISFARTLPNLRIFAPGSLTEIRETLLRCLRDKIPALIRYPRSFLPNQLPEAPPVANARVAIFGAGSCAEAAIAAAGILDGRGIPAQAYPVVAVKPLDEPLLSEVAGRVDFLVTVEENSMIGGFGSAVLECLCNHPRPPRILRIGLPDAFVEQGPRTVLLARYGLTAEKIAERVSAAVNQSNK